MRAEHYCVFLKRGGEDADPVNVADPNDLEFTLKGLPPGAAIEVCVVPMNDGGVGPHRPSWRRASECEGNDEG